MTQHPPEAPEFVTLIKQDLGKSGEAFGSLGVSLFDFLEAAGADVREAVLSAMQLKLSDKANITPERLRAMFVGNPGMTGMMVAASMQAFTVWTMLGMSSCMALTEEHLPLLKGIIDYYDNLPEDRKVFASAAFQGMMQAGKEKPDEPQDSFATMMKAQGMEVPAPQKPADDTVTGKDGEGARPPSVDLAAERKRLAEQHGVDPSDVIIFGEEDRPDGSN